MTDVDAILSLALAVSGPATSARISPVHRCAVSGRPEHVSVLEVDMKRREFITLLGSAAAWPFAARASALRLWMQPIMNAISDTTTGGATHAAARARASFVCRSLHDCSRLFGVIFLAVITGIMIVCAVLVFTMQWALGLFMMACAGLIAALTGYVWRDLRGKWGLRVVLDTDAVTLDLPAGARSFTVRWRSI